MDMPAVPITAALITAPPITPDPITPDPITVGDILSAGNTSRPALGSTFCCQPEPAALPKRLKDKYQRKVR